MKMHLKSILSCILVWHAYAKVFNYCKLKFIQLIYASLPTFYPFTFAYSLPRASSNLIDNLIFTLNLRHNIVSFYISFKPLLSLSYLHR